SRPQRGCHVSHRQETLGELASLRRERGTVSARPLTPADQSSLKDVSVTCVPLMPYGASTKASQVFNSTPTFPRRDFGCDCLLSLCFYGLLKTPRLLTTPRPYGNRRLVLAWSRLCITSFRVETLDLCDLVSHYADGKRRPLQPRRNMLRSRGYPAERQTMDDNALDDLVRRLTALVGKLDQTYDQLLLM